MALPPRKREAPYACRRHRRDGRTAAGPGLAAVGGSVLVSPGNAGCLSSATNWVADLRSGMVQGMAGSGAGSVKVPDGGELTPKGRATRDRIVAAAADLMFEQGVAGTSLQDVQQAARVSGSQLYHYFGDKASLVHAVIAWQGETVLGHQWPWLSPARQPAGHPGMAGLRGEHDAPPRVPGRLPYRLARQRAVGPGPGGPVGPGRRLPALDQRRSATACRPCRTGESCEPMPTSPRLACALMAAVEGGLLLAKAQRDVAPLEAALDTVIDHIASLTA